MNTQLGKESDAGKTGSGLIDHTETTHEASGYKPNEGCTHQTRAIHR